MKKIALISALMLAFLACDPPTMPPPPPPVTTTVPGPPPRVDQPFSWESYRGFTAFALGHPGQSETDITLLYAEAMDHGWNTARICAETEFWEGSAAYPIKPRDLDALQNLLDLIARIPSAQVLLVADCTLKGPVPIPEQIAWAREVAEVASQFQNVALEVVNEWSNCSGRGWGPHCPDRSDIREMVRAAHSAGVQYVTSDDSFCWDGSYDFEFSGIASPADFHPCRTDARGRPWDPSVEDLRRLVNRHGTVVLSETVAWMDFSGECSGLRTCSKERIIAYINACLRTGVRFTYHSENLLAGEPPTWWPEA